MSYPADFHAAHVRHWQDAELLMMQTAQLDRAP